MLIVSPEVAAEHVRADEINFDLQMKVEAASSRVLGYIGGGLKPYQDPATGEWLPEQLDDDGNWLAPADVKAAVLVLVGYLYRQRDEDGTSEFDGGELPRPVRALLRPYRKTVVA